MLLIILLFLLLLDLRLALPLIRLTLHDKFFLIIGVTVGIAWWIWSFLLFAVIPCKLRFFSAELPTPLAYKCHFFLGRLVFDFAVHGVWAFGLIDLYRLQKPVLANVFWSRWLRLFLGDRTVAVVNYSSDRAHHLHLIASIVLRESVGILALVLGLTH